jgi:hypothetical protein
MRLSVLENDGDAPGGVWIGRCKLETEEKR